MPKEPVHVTHGFSPVYDSRSRVLILGSMPSVKSREIQFYYGHPQNRFWRVLGAVLGVKFPADSEGKRALLLEKHVALWDVIAECDIIGSSDATVRNVVPNDMSVILDAAPIEAIFTNGGTASRVYARYQLKDTGREAIALPSTSPANAAWSEARLIEAWRVVGMNGRLTRD